MADNRIKKRKAEHKKIEKEKLSTLSKIDYPVFCFKHLQTSPKEDFKFFAEFIERLKKLCSLSWSEINKSHRHGFGTEKIPVKQIKPQLPSFVSPDVSHLTVFRANGDNRPFLGLRDEEIFHVIFIEEVFGDVYDHQ